MTRARLAAALAALLSAAVASAVTPVPIPHGGVAEGDGDVRRAWLSGPTGDYPHGVLGDGIEALTLQVESRSGAVLGFTLDDGTVFEDTTPRIADLDGDGSDEVWTVRAGMGEGARLEAYGIVAGRLVRRFATAPIGIGFRWLNPLGVADFDGDGRREAAYVRTPHIGGVLTIVRADGDRLVPVATRAGYSTHAPGSPRLDLGAVADLDGDGRTDLLVPDQTRRRFVALSLVGGELVERWRSTDARPVGGVVLTRTGEDAWRLAFDSAAGRDFMVIRPGELLPIAARQ